LIQRQKIWRQVQEQFPQIQILEGYPAGFLLVPKRLVVYRPPSRETAYFQNCFAGSNESLRNLSPLLDVGSARVRFSQSSTANGPPTFVSDFNRARIGKSILCRLPRQ
jgi:hypothetical protein